MSRILVAALPSEAKVSLSLDEGDAGDTPGGTRQRLSPPAVSQGTRPVVSPKYRGGLATGLTFLSSRRKGETGAPLSSVLILFLRKTPAPERSSCSENLARPHPCVGGHTPRKLTPQLLMLSPTLPREFQAELTVVKSGAGRTGLDSVVWALRRNTD